MSTASAPLMPQQIRVVAQTAYLGEDHGRVVRTITVPGEPAEAIDRWKRLRLAQPALRMHIEDHNGILVQRLETTAESAVPLCSIEVASSNERSTRLRVAIHHSLADGHSWSIIERALQRADISRFSAEEYFDAVGRINKRFDDAKLDDRTVWDEVARAINSDPMPARAPASPAIEASTVIDVTEWRAVSQNLGVGTSATALASTARALRSAGRRTPVVGVAVTLRDVAGFDLIGDFVEVVPLVVHQHQQLEMQLQQRLIDLHRVKWSWPAAFGANPQFRRAAFEGRLHDVTMSVVEAPVEVGQSGATPAVPHLQFDVAGRLDIIAAERERVLVEILLREIPLAILGLAGQAGRAEQEELLRRLFSAQLGHDVGPEDDLLAAGLTSLGMMRVAAEAVHHGLSVDPTMLFVYGSIEGICDALASTE